MMNKLAQKLTPEIILKTIETRTARYMSLTETVCFISYLLISKREIYGAEAVEIASQSYLHCSDTVFYQALTWFESQDWITSEWRKMRGPGRPRRYYRLKPEAREMAAKLSQAWETHLAPIARPFQP